MRRIGRKVALLCDFLRLREKGLAWRWCLAYYGLIFLGGAVFLMFLSFLFDHQSVASDEIGKGLAQAVERFKTRNISQSLADFDFDLKIKNLSSEENQLVFHYNLRYIDLEPGSKGVKLKNKEVLTPYSYPSGFLVLDQPSNTEGLFFPGVKFSKDILWTRESLRELDGPCLELRYQRFKEEKGHSVRKQKACTSNNNGTGKRGTMIKRVKFVEISLENAECESKTNCRELCRSENLLYFEEDFLRDKLLSRVSCQRVFVLSELCFIVKYDVKYEGFIFEGGCFGGAAEKFVALENIETEINFNKTKVIVREERDPFLFALKNGGEINEKTTEVKIWKKILLMLAGSALVVLGGILVMKWKGRKKKIRLEEFNQHEMSSASIKL